MIGLVDMILHKLDKDMQLAAYLAGSILAWIAIKITGVTYNVLGLIGIGFLSVFIYDFLQSRFKA